MNLGEIRDLVGTILDYDPEVQTYQDEVTDVVNQIYMDFFSDKQWQFAQKLVTKTARADRTIATGAYNGGSGAPGADVEINTTGNFFETWMEGQVISITGGTAVPASPTDTQVRSEYTIQKAVSATQAIISGGRFSTSESANGDATLIVKSRFFDMPYDCVSLISLGVRDIYEDTGPYDNVTKYLDETYDLDLDQTGRPSDWVRSSDMTMAHPRTAPVVAQGAADPAGMPVTGVYQVRYTFVHVANGRESAPSPPSAPVTSLAGRLLDVSGLQNTGTNSGLFKKLYIKTPESAGFYESISPTPNETDTTATGISLSTSYLTDSARAPEHSGHLLRVRLFPRQSTDLKVQIRFVKRPPMMLDDADVPEFPSANHRYLVYRACQELFVKHNNLQHSEMYRHKADAELLKMCNRHLTEGATFWIKRGYKETELYTAPTPSLTTLG